MEVLQTSALPLGYVATPVTNYIKILGATALTEWVNLEILSGDQSLISRLSLNREALPAAVAWRVGHCVVAGSL